MIRGCATLQASTSVPEMKTRQDQGEVENTRAHGQNHEGNAEAEITFGKFHPLR
jgi:hypothetical protein